MTAADAEKYLKLLNICDSFNLPLINFVDNEGISVKNSGGCMAALKKIFDFGAFTEVPKISVITGSAVGAGYSAFAAKGMGYGYTLAWADANIGIVSGQAQARLEFPGMLGKQEDRQAAIAKIESKINDMQKSALTAARSGFIDNVIDPALSRPYIISALRMLID